MNDNKGQDALILQLTETLIAANDMALAGHAVVEQTQERLEVAESILCKLAYKVSEASLGWDMVRYCEGLLVYLDDAEKAYLQELTKQCSASVPKDRMVARMEGAAAMLDALCQICLEPSTRSVCEGCEHVGGLFGDWRSDCDG